MEDLIWLFIAIIGMIWSILSKMKARRKAVSKAKPPDKAGWVTKLQAFLDDMRQRIEQQAKQDDTGSSAWEQLSDDSKSERFQTNYKEESLAGLVLENDEPSGLRPEPPAPPLGGTGLKRPVQKEAVPPGPGLQPGLRAQKLTPSRIAMGRSELHRAVIWSEILGPPVALRDPFGHRP